MLWIKDTLLAAAVALHLVAVSYASLVPRGVADIIYNKDGRTCCTDGEKPTAFTNGKCQYGNYYASAKLESFEKVTKCCWVDSDLKFNAHYKDTREAPPVDDIDISGSGQYPNKFCNLGLKWHITKLSLTKDYVSILIDLNVDCATYNKSDQEWVTIYFNHEFTNAAKFTYEISGIGPTIYVDLTTKVTTDDKGIDFHGHMTGTGILGRLDETFDANIAPELLEAILAAEKICN